MPKVVVIGGGVIGCAVAERLSFDGHQVTLLERDQLAARASGAAAGELSPQSNTAGAEESAQQSLLLFPELIARIEKDSGMNVEYRVQEGLQPAFDQEEAARLRIAGARWLDAQACRQAEPSLSTDVRSIACLRNALARSTACFMLSPIGRGVRCCAASPRANTTSANWQRPTACPLPPRQNT